MLNSVTIKSVAVVAFAGLVAGFAAFVPAFVPQAGGASLGAPQEHHGKGDRLPTRVSGAACSSLSWPGYEQQCQFDLRRSAGESRMVRVIALR
jgi:hypothetical protein